MEARNFEYPEVAAEMTTHTTMTTASLTSAHVNKPQLSSTSTCPTLLKYKMAGHIEVELCGGGER